jgi:hypothetical protein
MPPAAPATILRDAIRTAVRGVSVATAAGVAHGTWSAAVTAGGRVFDGDAGYLGSRNRGRLPFLELWVQDASEVQLSYDGGVSDIQVTLRVHVGGRDQATLDDLAGEILFAAVRAIRSLPFNHGRIGDGNYGQTTLGPWGSQRDALVRVQVAVEV